MKNKSGDPVFDSLIARAMSLEPSKRLRAARLFASLAREIIADFSDTQLRLPRALRGIKPGRN